MKMLVERFVTSEALPFDLSDLKAHMRVDHAEEDGQISAMGLTAAAEVEHLAQIALLTQTIRVTLLDPCQGYGLALPIGPVAADAVLSVTIDGEAFAGFDLLGGIRPFLRWQSAFQALRPGILIIEYPAGFGATAADIPADLSQAILDQALMHYEGRAPMDAKSMTVSPHMTRIAARYRGVSV